ncbi:YlbD family protein [Pseudalkalibacillus berkeleyi]|uniref:YlbD family protein n=1 Tax=Pseudalkalibacillus berkeleyi TaxID=1069813 RepID=A0ABS9GYU0_9BACL|nr:YlbD family protein [Pseudalkalibacillus berkeleyi]MCF6136981.1 YlbD family protein [Pseudalkalibacillus berkeleyi]
MSKQANNNEKVEQFKMFVRSHPGLIDHVKNGDQSWQDVFTEWNLLGEDHEQWGKYIERKIGVASKKAKKKTNSVNDLSVGELLNMFKNLDIEEVRDYVSQFSSAVTGIQDVLSQFQSKGPTRPPMNSHPFNQYFKD